MPKEEIYFEQDNNGRKLEVVKTYDRAFAREAFEQMNDRALGILADVLDVARNYDSADVPRPESMGYSDFLWEEMQDAAREDGNQVSFFVVSEAKGGNSESLFVSPDWPSAEKFAKGRLGTIPAPSPA